MSNRVSKHSVSVNTSHDFRSPEKTVQKWEENTKKKSETCFLYLVINSTRILRHLTDLIMVKTPY